MSPTIKKCYYCGASGESFLESFPVIVCDDCKKKIELLLSDSQFLDNYIFNSDISYAISNPQKKERYSIHRLKPHLSQE